MSTSLSKQANRVPYDSYARRRLDSIATAATATVAIASLQFNAKDRPSNEVDAGVTSITITASGDDEVLWKKHARRCGFVTTQVAQTM